MTERRLREREVDPSSDNRAGGLLNRARNALGVSDIFVV